MVKSKNHEEEIKFLLQAGTRIVEIVSFEYQRVFSLLGAIFSKTGWPIFVWDPAIGIKKVNENGKLVTYQLDAEDPLSALNFLETFNGECILVMEGYESYLNSTNPISNMFIRKLVQFSRKYDDKALILFTQSLYVPFEIKSEVSILELPLSDEQVIKQILESLVKKIDSKFLRNICITEELIASALGLTYSEIEHAFKKAVVKNGRVDNTIIPDILLEKENIVKASGYLTFEKISVSFDSIGGLSNLKEWCLIRGKGFSKAAQDYGLSNPKGLLLLGIPGCGKSLTAKAIANEWNLPLLRLDMGTIYGKWIGDSERNIRNSLAVAEAVSPCVLWVDEIEKGVKGTRSEGDSGVSARVFGTLLTWMQEKEKPVFVVATANDVSSIPPEMLRKGRFDELFFVDLPSEIERESIFKIHLKNFSKHIKYSKNDLKMLAKASEGFTGAEIEECINSSMFKGFAYNKDVISASDIIDEIHSVYPLSQTMSGTINNLRVWANSRCKMASIDEPVILDKDTDDVTPKISFSEFN